jgi:hypothetical protein
MIHILVPDPALKTVKAGKTLALNPAFEVAKVQVDPLLEYQASLNKVSPSGLPPTSHNWPPSTNNAWPALAPKAGVPVTRDQVEPLVEE